MTTKDLNKISKPITYNEFLQLCKDADNLIIKLLKSHSHLQGRRPKNLKAAAIWYLARKRQLYVTSNHLYQIYGIYQPMLIEIRKIIDKEAVQQQTRMKGMADQ
jgi:hypothetical protein